MAFTRTSLRLSAGAIVWAVHFMLVYGMTALACARGRTSWVAAAIFICTAAAIAAAIAIGLQALRQRDEFEHWLTAGVAGVAIVAMLWEALPALVLAPCA